MKTIMTMIDDDGTVEILVNQKIDKHTLRCVICNSYDTVIESAKEAKQKITEHNTHLELCKERHAHSTVLKQNILLHSDTRGQKASTVEKSPTNAKAERS